MCSDASSFNPYIDIWSFPDRSVVKNPSANAGDAGSIPGLGRSPGEGKSHGQRSLVGYSAWGGKRVGHDIATK